MMLALFSERLVGSKDTAIYIPHNDPVKLYTHLNDTSLVWYLGQTPDCGQQRYPYLIKSSEVSYVITGILSIIQKS